MSKRWVEMYRNPERFPELNAPLDARGNLCAVGDRVRSTPMLRKDHQYHGVVISTERKNIIKVDTGDGPDCAITSAAFLWEKQP